MVPVRSSRWLSERFWRFRRRSEGGIKMLGSEQKPSHIRHICRTRTCQPSSASLREAHRFRATKETRVPGIVPQTSRDKPRCCSVGGYPRTIYGVAESSRTHSAPTVLELLQVSSHKRNQDGEPAIRMSAGFPGVDRPGGYLKTKPVIFDETIRVPSDGVFHGSVEQDERAV